MDLEARAWHQERRLDLEEAALAEEPAHGRERRRARLEQSEPPARHAGDLGARPRVVAAGEPADDDLALDQIARPPPGPRDRAHIAPLAAHDGDLAVDRDHTAAHDGGLAVDAPIDAPTDRDSATADGLGHFATRSTYSCVRVSILMVSPPG